MKAKQPAAIIEGTMARPSRPSVKLTEFDAPVMTKMATGTKNQPRFTSTFLKNGTANAVPSQLGLMLAPRVIIITATAAMPLTAICASDLRRPERPDEERLVSFL